MSSDVGRTFTFLETAEIGLVGDDLDAGMSLWRRVNLLLAR